MLAACTVRPMPAAAALLLCTIVGITDGDTLTARCESQTIKVRLAEIDAREKSQPFADRSKQHLSSLCYRQQAEIHPTTKDRYGRTVARVYCAGVDANAAMVRDGMAWAYTKNLTDPKILEIEEQARVGRTGLWADASPVAPWRWRTPIRRLRFDPNREWLCFPHDFAAVSSLETKASSTERRVFLWGGPVPIPPSLVPQESARPHERR